MRFILTLLACGLLLSGCLTTGVQRVPITGGFEMSLSQGKKNVKINASGNTTVNLLDDGTLEVTTKDGFSDMLRTYNESVGK